MNAVRPQRMSDFTGPSRASGTQLNYMLCPVCGSTGWKTYVNPQDGKWFCFARAHSAGGRVEVDDWTDEAQRELLELLSGASTTGSGEPWPEVDLPSWMTLTAPAERYLDRRGILPELRGPLGLVEMATSPRILVPYRGNQGQIIYWTARAYASWAADAPKYLSAPGTHPLYMLPRWEPVDTAVLVEGVFDAIAVWQATQLPTIALGGKSLSRKVERDLRQLCRRRVVIMLDGDATADALLLSEALMDQFRCDTVPLEVGTDPADTQPEVLRELLR